MIRSYRGKQSHVPGAEVHGMRRRVCKIAVRDAST
jgi:hypothetical protein